MIFKLTYRILIALTAAMSIAACSDELPLESYGPFGKGESRVSLSIEYKPSGVNLGGTRSTSGDAIKDIENVFVVWYRPDSTLGGCRYLPQSELTITTQPRDFAEEETQTQHADFECAIPYGAWRIYAAVNMGDMSGDEDIKNERTFKDITLNWQSDNVAANNQMSGYFVEASNTAFAKGDAPTVALNKASMKLHSWVRRAASKVTIAFDARRLNENIYIYIKSARIKDIPTECRLVSNNTPTDENTLADGDTIQYGKGDDFEKDHESWLRLACGRGANYYGNHSNNAPSLFFYENMQGKHANKHQYNNFERKDSVMCGTYIEVEGYYVNNSSLNPSSGKIIYRCMLGKNMTDDFNAERNTHYKLTLVFNKDANDPDWHIEYDYEPEPPEIVVPNPMYISYLSNEGLNIPVTIYHAKGMKIQSLKAEIVRNDWGYNDHPYDHVKPELYNGFLSMELVPNTALSSPDQKYTSTKTFNTPTESNDSVYRFSVPVYTRPLNLGGSFSGNNYYVGRRRYAQVVLTATIIDVDNKNVTVRDTVDVIQVRRLVNPKGIWRAGNSEKEFRVTLKNSNSRPTVAEVFEDVISDGPWTARITKGADWVRIKDIESGTWGTEPVTGGTGSKVEFDYKPVSTTDGCRFGLIEITFHNNTCPHVILVSQGMGPVQMGPNKWHMSNVKYCGVDEANPLLEGSMFKFGCSTIAYKSSNNLKSGYGFRQEAFYKSFDVYSTDENGNTTDATVTFVGPAADIDGFTSSMMKKGNSHVATYEEWASINDTVTYDRFYGVMYGDECTETLSKNTVTNTYTNEGEEKGMRGCFVCDKTTGNHLFFPIGNTGHGRRQYKDYISYSTCKPDGLKDSYWGELKYADRIGEMDVTTAQKLPCYYDLWEEPGAIYWYDQRKKVGVKNDKPVYEYAFDINYMTFGFQSYTTERVYAPNADTHPGPDSEQKGRTQSDLCFLRRVYDN
ncbi:MAG: DUF4906 domain-containing protein [Prevotella sp.]|nr:DUF4906 domain-containing protein [Prevotella sp.]